MYEWLGPPKFTITYHYEYNVYLIYHEQKLYTIYTCYMCMNCTMMYAMICLYQKCFGTENGIMCTYQAVHIV